MTTIEELLMWVALFIVVLAIGVILALLLKLREPNTFNYPLTEEEYWQKLWVRLSHLPEPVRRARMESTAFWIRSDELKWRTTLGMPKTSSTAHDHDQPLSKCKPSWG